MMFKRVCMALRELLTFCCHMWKFYLGGKMVLWVLFIIDREWRRVLGHIQGIFFSEGWGCLGFVMMVGS